MAGGKQSPRQKMINLMYLVFIAMLALNMSKEVLQAFGLIEENLSTSNTALAEVNSAALADLNQKARTNAKQYEAAAATAQQISKLSNDYNDYLESVKIKLTSTIEEGSEKDYQVQDKTDILDNSFFVGDKLKPEGKEFKAKMNQYKNDMIAALGDGYSAVKAELSSKFDTSEETDREGLKREYVEYNYKGYPLIASKTKLTLLQNEVRNVQSDIMSQLLQGKLIQIASMNNYKSIVNLDKTAFFNGEAVTGSVVLGRYDDTTVPSKVVINGEVIKKEDIKNGQIALKLGSGSVGEKKITGYMEFIENDSIIKIPIDSEYAVIPKPNSATISADKMNVVYRGVENPMTVAFAGVPDNKVSVSGAGLTKAGTGYIMKPGAGKTVTITATGTLPNGDKVSDSKEFRIKNLPRPTGMVSKSYENIAKTRANLAISTVSAEFLDFDFDLTPKVTSFLFKVPGQPSVPVSGTKLNASATNVLRKARKGDLVQFAQIKAVLPGVNVQSVSDVTVEITD
ncbi:gliding motility protein GldM [Nonlabens sp.]|uniref:type IX secretion system motor protein PorM/GldM n=1 Tax=Nonlabens sp. TaxID=1888209 RepID=UPI001BD16899|nr:gliding motility protein GldM [Nonlabens sp.]